MLPAARQHLEEFLEAGFGAAVRRRGLPVLLQFVDPQLAHVTDESWLPALHEHLLAARSHAGGPLWLGGISLGAFLALRYAVSRAGGIDGLCLIAPYLGSRIVAAQVARGTDGDGDEQGIWSFLRQLHRGGPKLFVGLSRDDRFADTQRLLRGMLPPGACVEVPGRHDWAAWGQLWDLYLERLALPA